jgi:hypothetical protein
MTMRNPLMACCRLRGIMKTSGRIRCAIAAILFPLLSACGSSSSSSTPAAPTPAPGATLKASVGITSITVSGEARASGEAYHVTLHLHESAGTAATIVAVDLTFMNGATAFLSSHFDQPISDSSNVCPASGSVDTREFVIVDADASHAYATTTQAKVTFTDSSAAVGTTIGSAGVPALAAPPPQLFTLTGVITDMNTHAAITGARMDVLTGSNAGKSAMTDGSGTYVMRDLVADSFRLRSSASDYDPGEQGVTVPFNPRADFQLQRTPPNYAGTWTGQYLVTECHNIDPPGLTPLNLCGYLEIGQPAMGISYRFTASQAGRTVTGTFKQLTQVFICACGGAYGTFDMTSAIAPDGTLVMSGDSSLPFTGLAQTLTLNMNVSSSSTLTGTVSGAYKFGDYERTRFSGPILSGTR